MPRNSTGVYSLPSVSFAEPGTTIRADQQNVPHNDIADALTFSLPRNGRIPMMDQLPMGGYKITGLAQGTDPSDAARIDQVLPYSGYLASVSGLSLTANQITYSTGAGSAAATSLTPFGRSVIASADAQALRTDLALGVLATKDEVTIADIETTNAASATTFLRGDGSWQSVASIGVGQTWQNVGGSRVSNTSYQNTTGKPIMVSIRLSNSESAFAQVSPDNASWVNVGFGGGAEAQSVSFIVPALHYYRATGVFGNNWAELR